ncbi:GNAT family N-acetyltransferase [Propionibacteriaceae bacterium Y1700]|uniref:GNAT family N-acetyltransferase n=1 Tax=Microlunatus sp. Y1700 TaxID=3418487 RepID=UPI003DA71790
MIITEADLDNPAVAAFLQAHLDDIAPTAPQCSQHALDLEGLRRPGVRLWVAHDEEPIGTVALVPVAGDNRHEELKSMRTDPARRGQGVASSLLLHAMQDAADRGVRRVSLETGSMAFFAPARALYQRHGFSVCAPFGEYGPDPHSTFMTLQV